MGKDQQLAPLTAPPVQMGHSTSIMHMVDMLVQSNKQQCKPACIDAQAKQIMRVMQRQMLQMQQKHI
jgi:hypothetical protein